MKDVYMNLKCEQWTNGHPARLWVRESLSDRVYDAIHDVSFVGYQRARFTRAGLPHVATQGGAKGGTHLCQILSCWHRVDVSALFELLLPVQILTPLSSNPEPWERLCPFLGYRLLGTLSSYSLDWYADVTEKSLQKIQVLQGSLSF